MSPSSKKPRSPKLKMLGPLCNQTVNLKTDNKFSITNECLTEKLSGMCDTCTSIADEVIFGKKYQKGCIYVPIQMKLKLIFSPFG